MRLTVYGGANGIGGNLVLLADADGSLLLDCGISFTAWSRYFHTFHQPAAARGLHDHLLLGLVPPLQGLYREDLLPPEVAPWPHMPRVQPARPDAILLTHAHRDHCGALPYVDPDIPVYASAETAMVLHHLQEWGNAQLDGEYRYTRRRVLRHGVLRTSAAAREGEHRQRRLQLPPDEPWPAVAPLWDESPGAMPWVVQAPVRSTRVGPMEVRMFPVDHSMVGSTAFAVQTTAGWVVYTGDLRQHGRQGHLTRAFADAAARLRPEVLLIEGTNAATPSSLSEEEVGDRLYDVIRNTAGAAVLGCAPRNLDRLLTAHAAATATGRRLLLMDREADFIRSLRHVRRDLPDPDNSDGLWVHRKARVRTGRADPDTSDYIRRHPDEFVIACHLSDLNELLPLRLPPGGRLIYASHRPYNLEQAGELERYRHWANALGMAVSGIPAGGFHASGHLTSVDLMRLVETIRPRRLVPVHTEHPEFFVRLTGKGGLCLPQPGEPLEF